MSYQNGLVELLQSGFVPVVGSYEAGFRDGCRMERTRIVGLLEGRADDWLSHDGVCDCRVKGKEVESVVALIKGEES